MRNLRGIVISAATLACVAVAAPAAMGFVQITSPSRNIDCIVDATSGGSASCLVEKTTWKHYPARPKSCDLDWVRSQVTLWKRKVTLGGCRGDVGPQCIPGQATPCRVLAYGKSVVVGGIRCTSTTSGMVCRRTTGKKRQGFKVSKQGYTLYR